MIRPSSLCMSVCTQCDSDRLHVDIVIPAGSARGSGKADNAQPDRHSLSLLQQLEDQVLRRSACDRVVRRRTMGCTITALRPDMLARTRPRGQTSDKRRLRQSQPPAQLGQARRTRPRDCARQSALANAVDESRESNERAVSACCGHGETLSARIKRSCAGNSHGGVTSRPASRVFGPQSLRGACAKLGQAPAPAAGARHARRPQIGILLIGPSPLSPLLRGRGDVMAAFGGPEHGVLASLRADIPNVLEMQRAQDAVPLHLACPSLTRRSGAAGQPEGVLARGGRRPLRALASSGAP